MQLRSLQLSFLNFTLDFTDEDLQPSTEIRRFAEEEDSSEDDEEALSKLFSQAKQSRHGSGTLGSKVGRRMNVKRNTVGQAYKPKQSVPRTEDATEEEENKGVRGMPLSFIQSISATTKSGNVVEKQIVQSNLLIGKDEKGEKLSRTSQQRVGKCVDFICNEFVVSVVTVSMSGFPFSYFNQLVSNSARLSLDRSSRRVARRFNRHAPRFRYRSRTKRRLSLMQSRSRKPNVFTVG